MLNIFTSFILIVIYSNEMYIPLMIERKICATMMEEAPYTSDRWATSDNPRSSTAKVETVEKQPQKPNISPSNM
eukprot:m.99288 g.99288  ORF g.99288 m.99288 type:complete len:74 (+) comp13673_c0_seq2:1950-2171(+)